MAPPIERREARETAMHELNRMVGDTAAVMGVEDMSDEELRAAERGAEQAATAAVAAGADAAEHILQALACYGERESRAKRRAARPPFVDVSYEVVVGDDVIRMSNQVRVF